MLNSSGCTSSLIKSCATLNTASVGRKPLELDNKALIQREQHGIQGSPSAYIKELHFTASQLAVPNADKSFRVPTQPLSLCVA